jgi:hypothetical protein
VCDALMVAWWRLMMRYKDGDRVRVVAVECGAPDDTLGEVGVIDYANETDNDYRVEFSDGKCWYYREDELEIFEPAALAPTQNLRDQFALAALTSIAPNSAHNAEGFEDAARKAYGFADAMMRERDKS